MFYTDDPIADFSRHFDEQEAEHRAYIESLPKCEYCRKPIEDDYCYVINDEPICEECLEHYHRKKVEHLVC